MSETLQAPYRFVPLSPFVLRPDWGPQVSHDHPFSDGVCGELDIELTALTELCVGGQQTPSSEHTPGRVHFYRTPDNQLAIPGSSIKGMLRNILNIACFGHFNQVQDQRLGVRDISKGENFYSKAMNRSTVYTGWLKFVDREWQIIPCDYVRILQADLIQHLNIKKQDWTAEKNKTAIARYKLLGGLKPMNFDIEDGLAVNLGKGEKPGVLVVTGQPGSAFDDPDSKKRLAAKKREFVFYNSKPENLLTVGEKALQGFMQIHAETNEWKFWLGKINQLEQGIPVFFHKEGQQVKSIGLARMYKLAYEHSLHDAIGHTSKEHLNTMQPDLAGLLFGWLDKQDKTGSSNLRGRVQPGLLVGKGEMKPDFQQPTVLSSPKPTFYPAYVQQGTPAYKTLMDKDAELAGWKRYPARIENELPDLSAKVENNKKVQVQLETVGRGSSFSGKIRFHNLRMIELGALLWALDFNNEACVHSLGTGKPYGFGQVRLKLTNSITRPNSSTLQELPDDMRLATARRAFLHYMNHCWQQVLGKPDANWEHSPSVKALLEMANPVSYQNEILSYYAEPKLYMNAKQRNLRFAVNQTITEVEYPKTLPNTIAEDTSKSLQDYAVEAKIELEKLQQQAQLAQQKAEREARRATLSYEQQQLEQLHEFMAKDDANFTKSELDNLAKKLNELQGTAINWSGTDLLQLSVLAQKAVALAQRLGKEKDKLGKSAKKLLQQTINPGNET